jgi:hypothetical protein
MVYRGVSQVIIIKFDTAYGAEQCVKQMNGKMFGEKQASSFYWDGVKDFTKGKASNYPLLDSGHLR